MPGILEVHRVSKAFGGVQALYRVAFSVDKGEIRGIIGPNGAGKTTLFNLITGVLPPDEGRILFQGKDIAGRPMHRLVHLGIARTFQNVELFHTMTAEENIMVGAHARLRCGMMGAIVRWPWVRREERRVREKAEELLRFVGLGRVLGRRSGDLPFGWQRLVEIARALASDPRLLLLDEPAAGLNPTETERLATLIRAIRDRGVTVVLVEHDMNLTMEISHRILVLDQGRVLAEGFPRDIQNHEAVMKAYLGTKTH